MPATNPPRHGLGQPPITHLLRATRPLLVTHCPSSNHLIGDRVNTETSNHHQRVGLSSPLVTPQAPYPIPVTWTSSGSSSPLAWAKRSSETPVGWTTADDFPGASNHVLCWSGPRAGTPGEPHHCQHHLWWGRGSASSQELDKQPSLLHLPHTHWGAPRGFEDSPMHNAQFAPNFLCT